MTAIHRRVGQVARHAGQQNTAAGPFDYWPTGYGFEYFYGFLAGEASQDEPSLVRNTPTSNIPTPRAATTTTI